jgi:hypothetical protein
MRRCGSWLAGWLAVLMLFGDLAPCQAAEPRKASRRLWVASVAALVAASALDIASSRNGIEANPLMRSQNGTFSMTRGVLLKSGFSTGIIVSGLLVSRHSPSAAKQLAIFNFGTAAALTGLSVRNWKMPPASSQ